jgi:hypothetical protein
VGKDSKLSTDIAIPTHTGICLKVNTHTGTLDYFINNKCIKDRVVNVPKDVYFGVWYFICYLLLFIDMKILYFKIINNKFYSNIFSYFF